MKFSYVIYALLLTLYFTACREEISPLVAGAVSYTARNGTWVEKPLTTKQLQALSQWLARSSSSWEGCFFTPPPPKLTVSLKHANGVSSYISQLNFSNSQTMFMASYLSGINLSEQPCAVQHFTEIDIDSLYRLLSVPR